MVEVEGFEVVLADGLHLQRWLRHADVVDDLVVQVGEELVEGFALVVVPEAGQEGAAVVRLVSARLPGR